jgi:6,7-dimethyl-8-ribityllumazine synthase
MVRVVEGKPNAQGLKIGIVVSRFNNFVTEKLLAGALDAISSHGGAEENITVARVPGAFEIPLIAKKMAGSGRFDALVCLGAVIRGDTPHFDYVCEAVTRELGKAIWEFNLPIGFGVLTTDNVQQALDRAGVKDANKGYEAALTAIEMVDGMRQVLA